MFSHASRLPTGSSRERIDEIVLPPWGLSRMEPYQQIIEVDYAIDGIDPETQLGRYVQFDGNLALIDGKHRATDTNTRNATRTGAGGDQDHSNDSDSD